MELWDGAEAERVLERASVTLLPLEQRAKPAERVSKRPGDGRTDASGRVEQRATARAERLEGERPATSRAASSSRASWIARRRGRGERALVQEGDALARRGRLVLRRPTARSAVRARSACPIEPSDRKSSRSSAVSARRRARRAPDGRPRALGERVREAAPRRAPRRAGAPGPGRSGAGGAAAPRDRPR